MARLSLGIARSLRPRYGPSRRRPPPRRWAPRRLRPADRRIAPKSPVCAWIQLSNTLRRAYGLIKKQGELLQKFRRATDTQP